MRKLLELAYLEEKILNSLEIFNNFLMHMLTSSKFTESGSL